MSSFEVKFLPGPGPGPNRAAMQCSAAQYSGVLVIEEVFLRGVPFGARFRPEQIIFNEILIEFPTWSFLAHFAISPSESASFLLQRCGTVSELEHTLSCGRNVESRCSNLRWNRELSAAGAKFEEEKYNFPLSYDMTMTLCRQEGLPSSDVDTGFGFHAYILIAFMISSFS